MPLVAASWQNNPSFGCSRDSVQSVGSLPSIEEDDERNNFDDSESECEDCDAGDIYEALNSVYEQRKVEAVCGDATLPQSHACSISSHDIAGLRSVNCMLKARTDTCSGDVAPADVTKESPSLALEDDSCLDAFLSLMSPFLENDKGPVLPGVLALEDRNSSRNNSPVRAPEHRIDGRRVPVSSSILTDEDLVSAHGDLSRQEGSWRFSGTNDVVLDHRQQTTARR